MTTRKLGKNTIEDLTIQRDKIHEQISKDRAEVQRLTVDIELLEKDYEALSRIILAHDISSMFGEVSEKEATS